MHRFHLGVGFFAALAGAACQATVCDEIGASHASGGATTGSTSGSGSGAIGQAGGGAASSGGDGVCDAPGGFDPASPWPMLGGCPTRRGESRYVGSRSGTIAWGALIALPPYGDPGGVTLGGDGTVYATWGNYGEPTLLALKPDGTITNVFPFSADEPPAIGKDGMLFAVSIDDYVLQGLSPDGTVKWSVHPMGDGDTRIALGPDGTIIGAHDGSLIATSSLGKTQWSLSFNGFVLGSSPAVAPDGMVYVVTPELTAVTPYGTVAWKRDLHDSYLSTPAIDHDGTIYVGNEKHLYAFRPDGSTKWDAVVSTENDLQWVAIGPDGTVYTTGWGNAATLYAVSPDDGSVKWSYTASGVGVDCGAPVVDAEGVIYAPLGTQLVAVRPDGTLLWSHQAADRCSDVAIAADGMTYAVCDGEVAAFAP